MSASLNGDNSNIQSTTLIGQGLVAVGTNSRQLTPTGSDYGTVFVGRWNSDLGTKDTTAETVFAVGTGTGVTNRKTGFLIDSGSNTFVEGTLNVSGSSSFTGSMNVLSGSASGSVITNVGDTFTGTEAVTKIISLSSAEYTALSPKDPNTLYIIV
jgi:autotransporter-associated beta strand protein